MATVTVAIPTFGDLGFWQPLAMRAVESVRAQTVPCELVRVHGESLHGARNQALSETKTEWLVNLDADDELAPDYVERMLEGKAEVRAPAVVYVQADGRILRPARVPCVVGHEHSCVARCLDEGNWVIVGAMIRRELLERVGGWQDWPVYEDYATFAACWKAGATFEPIHTAIYRAHVRPLSRNRGTPRSVRHATHQAIARANGLRVPA